MTDRGRELAMRVASSLARSLGFFVQRGEFTP